MRQYLERIYGRSNNEFKALLKNDLIEKNKRFVITLDTVKLDKHFVYYLILILEIIKKI